MKKAIIVDIDGTIAFMKNRTPYEYHKAVDDGVYENILVIVKKFMLDHEILLVTGRDGECKDVTEKWLKKNDVYHDALFMRTQGDRRQDCVVKKELYDRFIKDNYNVIFILEDRTRVVKMWRGLGLTCLQVKDGDY